MAELLPDEPVTQDMYIERWENALRVLEAMAPHEREQHFDMSDWGKKTDCGTVACLAGHCSLDPWFRERGFIGEFYTRKDFRSGEDIAVLDFDKLEPDDFFGDIGEELIFLKTAASYEWIVKETRAFIEYLKAGGAPVTEDKDYDDE